jgi:hypothetical protein
MAQREKTIAIPISVMLSVESLEELEDWLLVNNPEFIKELRRIRDEEDLPGKGKTIEELRNEWGIPS